MAETNNSPINEGMKIEDLPDSVGPLDMLFRPIQTSSAVLKFLTSTLFNIIRLSCVVGETLFRRNFGMRYFNFYLYAGGVAWLWLFSWGIIDIPAMAGFDHETLLENWQIFPFIWVIFLALMFYHIVIRKIKDIEFDKLSTYDGDVMPFLYHMPFAVDSKGMTREKIVRQYHEPFMIAFFGVICSMVINTQTGSFLFITAFGFAVKEWVMQQASRNMILDHVDADIIARNMKDALKGENVKNTQGVYISGLPTEGKMREKFLEAVKDKSGIFIAK